MLNNYQVINTCCVTKTIKNQVDVVIFSTGCLIKSVLFQIQINRNPRAGGAKRLARVLRDHSLFIVTGGGLSKKGGGS